MYLRFDEARDRRFYFAALVFFLCALFTKTVTATLQASLLVVFWWQRGRLDAKRDAMPLAPFFAAGIAAGLFTAWVERTMIGAQGADFDLSIVERILIAGRAVWFYLGKLVWPSPLVFVYPRWEVSAAEPWQFGFPLALVIVLFALWRIRHRTRAPLAALLLFCGALFPALGFIDVYPFRFSFVADHFAYLASIPAIVLVAAALSRVPKQFLAAVAVPVLMLAVLTWRQSANYASAETLYRATLQENPSAWMAHNNLGKLLAEDGRNAEARAHFTEAVRLNGGVAEHHMNLGRLLIAENVLPEAEQHLSDAVRLDAGSANAHSNLGVALLRQGKSDAARAEFENALRIDPQHAEGRENLAALHVSLGVGHAQAGRIEEAAPHFEEAASIKPYDAMIRYNLGTAYLALGRAREAIPHLEEAVRLAPDSDEARANLEVARRSAE
jgi:Flp pilus assembly protein TadD